MRRADYFLVRCHRCGITREINRSRQVTVCRDCRSVESREAMRELRRDASPLDAGGTWVRHGLILRWQPPAPKKRKVKRLSTPEKCAEPIAKTAEHPFDENTNETREKVA